MEEMGMAGALVVRTRRGDMVERGLVVDCRVFVLVRW